MLPAFIVPWGSTVTFLPRLSAFPVLPTQAPILRAQTKRLIARVLLDFMGLLAAHAKNVHLIAIALGVFRNISPAVHTPRPYPAHQIAQIVNACRKSRAQAAREV
jgi:hypothetical protein